MVTAFSYLRFSTPEQQRGDSFRRQKNLAESYARENNLRLDPRSFADLGVSAFRGANLDGGMLGVFREAVKLGTVPTGSYLLVESLDRLSRDIPRKAVRVLEDICEAGITVVTLADNKAYDEETIDSDPMALMFAYVVAMRAYEESERKSGRIRSAWNSKRQAAALKRPMTAICPGWLTLSEDRKAYVSVPERVIIVRRIFSEYLQGKGTHGIAQGLNRDGIAPFGRAALWHRSYIVKILENSAVVGRFIPHTIQYVDGKKTRKPQEPIEDYFPLVIGHDDFARVQIMRSGRRSPVVRSSGRSGVSHLLAGLARCPRCRSSMTRVNKGRGPKGGHPYLVCSKAKAGAGCEYRSVRVDRLEEAIVGVAAELVRKVPKGSKTMADVRQRLEVENAKLG